MGEKLISAQRWSRCSETRLFAALTQKRLLAEADLNYKRAIQIAQVMETAELNSEQLNSSSHTGLSPQELPQVTKQILSSRGTGGIKSATVVAIQATLLNVENWVTFSMSAEASQSQNPHTLFAVFTRKSTTLYSRCMVENDRAPPIMIEMDINGQVVELELDTGAAYSLVSEKTYHDHWPNAVLTPLKSVSFLIQGKELKFLEVLMHVSNISNNKHNYSFWWLQEAVPVY